MRWKAVFAVETWSVRGIAKESVVVGGAASVAEPLVRGRAMHVHPGGHGREPALDLFSPESYTAIVAARINIRPQRNKTRTALGST